MLKNQIWTFLRDESNHSQEKLRQRQVLTIVFAIAIALLAGVAQAQTTFHVAGSQSSLQYDGATSVPTPAAGAVVDPTRVSGGAVATKRLRGNDRPAYVELHASLSNFDADADPDGWRVDVILRDHNDKPVSMRASATFELMPRLPSADFHQFVNARSLPVRWSMPLDFDDDQIARVKLPLRKSLQPVLGWPSSLYDTDLTRNRRYGRHLTVYGSRRTFVTEDLRATLATPTHGQLSVRVSVPTEGVFKATVPVRVRPPVLVDTNWPYR